MDFIKANFILADIRQKIQYETDSVLLAESLLGKRLYATNENKTSWAWRGLPAHNLSRDAKAATDQARDTDTPDAHEKAAALHIRAKVAHHRAARVAREHGAQDVADHHQHMVDIHDRVVATHSKAAAAKTG